MATRRPKPPQIQQNAPVQSREPADLAGDGEEDVAQSAMLAIRAAANDDTGGDWECDVYRVMGANRDGIKSPWLFACDISELRNLRFKLADMYHEGGRFRVRVRKDSVLFRQFDIEIEKRLPSMMPVAQNRPQEESNSAIVSVLDRMMQRQEQFMEAIILRLSAAPAPAASAPSLDSTIDTFVKLQGLLPKGQQESSIEMFQKGMDFTMKMVEATGGGGRDTNLMDMGKAILESPVVKDALAMMFTNAAAAQNPQHQQPGHTMIAPAASPPGGMPPAATHMIDQLCQQAALGTDPVLVATQAEAMMPAALLDLLEQQTDIVAYLEGLFPQVTPHRAWFKNLVDQIFVEDDEQDDTAPPPAKQQQPQAQGTFANVHARPDHPIAPSS